jgi:iron complex outermembrane receptor protein
MAGRRERVSEGDGSLRAAHRIASAVSRACLAMSAACSAFAADAQPPKAADLADLSIEELANLQITSVSRRAELLSDAAASIYVVTGDDVRRSGVTSLPEALRLAPNLQVARVDARQYAIGARGFNSTTANKLLVLIDGRTVYTPLFSGVFWDAQDVLLEDLDRIEVLSGPGATLWGANAVNGIINVISRRAQETQGVLAFGGIGNRENGVGIRYGAPLGGGAFRIYAKGFDRDSTVRANGTSVPDGWHNAQAGFRADWGRPADGLTLQGDAYRGTIDQAAPGDVRISGANLLARWARQLASGSSVQVQAYLDQTEREIPGSFAERLDTFDVEFQHAFEAAGHLVTWGGGYRSARDRVTNSAALAFLPANDTLHWGNVFVQDEIRLGERLRLTAGAKLASNPYTGWEFLPSARVAWKLDAQRMLWGAVSRAVRAPARLDRELFIPGQPPFLLAGGADFRSEIAKVLEVGYRAQPSARLKYSATVFHADYEHLRSLEPTGGGQFVIANQMRARVNGLEAWGTWQPLAHWRLGLGALFLSQRRTFEAGSGDTNLAAAGNDPKRQFSLRSSLDLSRGQELDVIARHVGRLPNPVVPSYTAVDLRYAWRVRNDLEISVTGTNLFDRRHPEFGSAAARSEIERGIFVKVKWTS